MVRWVRAVTAVVVAVALFFGSLWVFHYVTWSWLPSASADRWVVAAGFATLVGTSVFLLFGTWVDSKSPKSGGGDTGSSDSSSMGGRDRIEVQGPFHGPTVIKGTQINRAGKSDQR